MIQKNSNSNDPGGGYWRFVAFKTLIIGDGFSSSVSVTSIDVVYHFDDRILGITLFSYAKILKQGGYFLPRTKSDIDKSTLC